jgi:magnesium chelatase family protein
MRARRLATTLSAMSLAEAIQSTRIHSVAGRTGDCTALVTTRPFHALHQTISRTVLTCGTGRADVWLGSPVSPPHQ